MVSIIIYTDQNKEFGKYTGFDCKGHAGFAQHGEDIVCAALSMLVINTINSLDQLTFCKMDVDTDEDKGIIKVRFNKTNANDEFVESVDTSVDLLLDSMILGINQVIKEYNSNRKKYAEIKFKQT